jgi:hypothetical protein
MTLDEGFALLDLYRDALACLHAAEVIVDAAEGDDRLWSDHDDARKAVSALIVRVDHLMHGDLEEASA